jgi:hypothetical protein
MPHRPLLLITLFSLIHLTGSGWAQAASSHDLENTTFSGEDKEIHYKETLKLKSVSGDTILFDLNTEADYADLGEVCEGEIENEKAKLVNDRIVFEGQEGCRLQMQLSKDHERISITDNNCNYYHGANCDFGGKNLKRKRAP